MLLLFMQQLETIQKREENDKIQTFFRNEKQELNQKQKRNRVKITMTEIQTICNIRENIQMASSFFDQFSSMMGKMVYT